jgi:hypothetical protein
MKKKSKKLKNLNENKNDSSLNSSLESADEETTNLQSKIKKSNSTNSFVQSNDYYRMIE